MSGTYLSKIPVLVVALVIGIVLVTSAVVPLASDYSDAKTFTNEGYFRMEKYAVTDSFTAKWDHTDPYALTVGTDHVDLPTEQQTIEPTIIGSDNFLMRYIVRSNNVSVQFFADGETGISASVTDANDMTITATAGSISFYNGTTTKTVSYTGDVYVCSSEGDFTMKKIDKPAYVLDDSDIFATGRTYVLSTNFTTVLSGTIEDIDRSFWPEASVSTWTIGNVNITSSPVSGYENLNSIDKFDWTVSDGTNNATVTYSQFIVPYEVSADTDNPAAYKNLVKVVPLMAFIMLVVAAAGMVYFKNKD